jgi:hypothetical protein
LASTRALRPLPGRRDPARRDRRDADQPLGWPRETVGAVIIGVAALVVVVLIVFAIRSDK